MRFETRAQGLATRWRRLEKEKEKGKTGTAEP